MAEKLKGYKYSVVVEKGKEPEPITLKFQDGVLFPPTVDLLPAPFKLEAFDPVDDSQIKDLNPGSLLAQKPDGTKLLASGEAFPGLVDYPYAVPEIISSKSMPFSMSQYVLGPEWQIREKHDDLKVKIAQTTGPLIDTLHELSPRQSNETVDELILTLREGPSMRATNSLLLLEFMMSNGLEASAMKAIRGVREFISDTDQDLGLRTKTLTSLSKVAKKGKDEVAVKATKSFMTFAKNKRLEEPIRSGSVAAMIANGTDSHEIVGFTAVKGLDSFIKDKNQPTGLRSRGIMGLADIAKGASSNVAKSAVRSIASLTKSKRQEFGMRIYSVLALSEIAQTAIEPVALVAVEKMQEAINDPRGEIIQAVRDKLAHISSAGLGRVSTEAKSALD